MLSIQYEVLVHTIFLLFAFAHLLTFEMKHFPVVKILILQEKWTLLSQKKHR